MRGLGRIDSVSSILEGLTRRLGLESKLLENRLRRDWSSIVGEPLASNTWPDQIRYKKLYLLVHNSVWLHQLTFLKPTLLHTLNNVAGGELITDIVLRIGALPGAGRMPVSPEILPATIFPPGEALLAEVSTHVTTIQDPILRDRLAQIMAQALAHPQASKTGGAVP
jgi:Dna[CI] antecedent, DciA